MRRVKGFYRYKISPNGHIYRDGKPLKQDTSSGYARVTLYMNGKRYKFLVHRLVAQHFYVPGDGEEVNHKDGNKLNNCVDNLELCTPKQNIAHAIKTGLRDLRGEKNGSAKLSKEQVAEIRVLLKDKFYLREVAEMYNVHLSTIKRIKYNMAWNHAK